MRTISGEHSTAPHPLQSARSRERAQCGGAGRSSATFVDVAAVPNGDHQDDQHVVVDCVDDSVAAGTDPPIALSADQLLGPARPRLIGEKLDGRLDAPPGGRVERAQLT